MKEKKGQACEREERGRERKQEEKPQGRLSPFVFPLPSTGKTVTRKRERRVGEVENNCKTAVLIYL